MLQPARPPHVRFEKRPLEDRAASIEAGHMVYKDVDFAIITPVGGKDVIEKVAAEWLADIEKKSHVGQYDPDWVDRFKKMHGLWQRDEELPEDGTPIKTSQLFTPAEIANCAAVGIRTLEDLAAANEEALGRIGMGARNMKERAKNALLAMGGEAVKLASQLSAAQSEIDLLKEQLANAVAKIDQLASERKKG